MAFGSQPIAASDVAAKLVRIPARAKTIVARRIGRLCDKAYYRFVFGLQAPGFSAWNRKLADLHCRRRAGDVPVPREIWEAEYRCGKWAYLQGLEQGARYSVIAGYIEGLNRHGSILDVGCGEGILLDRLGSFAYSKFVGIDISHTAVERAKTKHCERALFVQASAEEFASRALFDAIVFNEVLYYLHDPLAVAGMYCRNLKAHGLLITSMYAGSERAEAIRRLLKKFYATADEVMIKNNSSAWVIDVFLPGAKEPIDGGSGRINGPQYCNTL